MLDLLKIGGRAAVIVPDGVLFGNTKAHRELRRQLLFENTLEAVVSLPANMFQPYSGVKTSILLFQKAGERLSPRAPNPAHAKFGSTRSPTKPIRSIRGAKPSTARTTISGMRCEIRRLEPLPQGDKQGETLQLRPLPSPRNTTSQTTGKNAGAAWMTIS